MCWVPRQSAGKPPGTFGVAGGGPGGAGVGSLRGVPGMGVGTFGTCGMVVPGAGAPGGTFGVGRGAVGVVVLVGGGVLPGCGTVSLPGKP